MRNRITFNLGWKSPPAVTGHAPLRQPGGSGLKRRQIGSVLPLSGSTLPLSGTEVPLRLNSARGWRSILASEARNEPERRRCHISTYTIEPARVRATNHATETVEKYSYLIIHHECRRLYMSAGTSNPSPTAFKNSRVAECLRDWRWDLQLHSGPNV